MKTNCRFCGSLIDAGDNCPHCHGPGQAQSDQDSRYFVDGGNEAAVQRFWDQWQARDTETTYEEDPLRWFLDKIGYQRL